MAFQPFVNGLRLGTLVEIYNSQDAEVNGQLGQLISYSRDTENFTVVLINGNCVHVSSSNVKLPQNLTKPGDGASEHSFDILMGPKTPSGVLAEEMSACIFEKGFCVLRTCQSSKEVDKAVDVVKKLGENGKLSRLPEEVEEGYLGIGGTGKIMWLDPDSSEAPDDEILKTNDHNMSYLASLFQPFSSDALGKAIAERSPALLSLSLPDDDEDDYPHPAADDKTLGDFLATWQRGLLRVVHFMGPTTANVTLESRDGFDGSSVPSLQDSLRIAAPPNTIIVFRTDCYDYSCEADGEFLTMMTSFTSQRPQLIVDNFDGMDILLSSGAGPKPPQGDCINIMNLSTRLGCRCDEPDMYGSYLQACTDGVTMIPLTRFDITQYYEPNAANILMSPDKSYTKHMAYVDGTDIFDNKYFEISNAEGSTMDPLQRQVLEVGGASMAMQGITKKVANRDSHHASVSVGVDKSDWQFLCSSGSCNATAIIANRFSFVFNLKGPNFVCDTACSASLVATHLAKLMLLERVWDPLEFHLAIGTHWCGHVGPFIGTSQGQMSSPGGRSFTFNATADGYLRGEGTSGIFMQYGNLPKEREAIWRASSSTQDGRSASLTAPNGPAQESAINKAMREARLQPPESTAWECHGTGTSLGDPIEVGALRKTQVKATRHSPLMIGSAKSNTGHLEGGAAMAGIVKCCLSVMRSRCMPTNHCHTLNPHLEATTFTSFFAVESMSFPHQSGHAQVSSFGFGGTNGHGILWGDDLTKSGDVGAEVMRRIAGMKAPEVRVYGRNPDEWESDWIEKDAKPGDNFDLVLNSERPSETALKVIKVEKAEADEVFYSITGDFNGWGAERMLEGEIAGLYTATIEVPSSGSLEFRFLEKGDKKKALSPQSHKCSRRVVPILGPGAELENTWLISGAPGNQMQIELLVQKDRKSVMWLEI